jgi:zinc/manganese transport system permease protein
MHEPLAAVFAPGFFASSAVRRALAIGGAVALVSAAVGAFSVIRGQSFAAHALGDIGASGGSSAYLAGIAPLWGFVWISVLAAAAMELIGVQRARGRDLATGVVLGAGYGLAALFLYLGATGAPTSGAPATVLFGSIFALEPSLLVPALALAGVALVLLGALSRPLLLSSLSPELAAARGVPVRTVGALYLLALALAVALAAVTIGAILSTALLIGPAAAALALCRRPARAVGLAALLGIAATWLGVLLAYDSYDWPPLHHGWPASFFIVALVVVIHLGARALARARRRR